MFNRIGPDKRPSHHLEDARDALQVNSLRFPP